MVYEPEIMVVDDEPDMRALMRAILEDSGFQVTEAEDGKDAVTKAGKRDYDLILMDAVMPVMDGFTACKKIVEDAPNAKVIFLTGYSTEGWEELAVSAGAITLLEKPFEPTNLISLLKSVVGGDATESAASVA